MSLQQRQRKLNFFSRGNLPREFLSKFWVLSKPLFSGNSTSLGSKNKVDLESKTICSSNKSCLYLFKRNHIFRLPLRLNLGRLSLYVQINCQELPATVCGNWCELDIDVSLRSLTNLLAVPAFSLAKQLITQKQAHIPSYPYLCIRTLTSSVIRDQLLLAALHTHEGRGGVCSPWPAVSHEHQRPVSLSHWVPSPHCGLISYTLASTLVCSLLHNKTPDQKHLEQQRVIWLVPLDHSPLLREVKARAQGMNKSRDRRGAQLAGFGL